MRTAAMLLALLGGAWAAPKSLDCAANAEEALKIARELERLRGDKGLFAYEIGVIHAALGEDEKALSWLTRAVQERSGWIAYLRVDPRLDRLHDDPRFNDLLVDKRNQG